MVCNLIIEVINRIHGVDICLVSMKEPVTCLLCEWAIDWGVVPSILALDNGVTPIAIQPVK